MKRSVVGLLTTGVVVALLATVPQPVGTQEPPARSIHLVAIAPSSLADLRAWDAELTRMRRDGTLELIRERDDTLLPGRRHERLAQYYRGLRVFGAEVTSQSENGVPISVLGVLYRDIDVPTTPQVSGDQAREIMLGQPGAEGTLGDADLLILPLDTGGFALAYRIVTVFPEDILVSFVDAVSGRIVMQHSDIQKQFGAAIGRGVLGDAKKMSTELSAGVYRTADGLRPPAIQTFDLKGNLMHVSDVLRGRITLGAADLATDSDNEWTDGAIVDAHTYAGWTYDYYFRRFGRRGLDNRDLPIRSIVHPVRRDDFTPAYFQQNAVFFTNAFWSGTLQLMVYGVGLPPNERVRGQTWDFTSGALDIVAHELTHGVTQFSSNLTYRNESGALNEAFSDIMATSVEFFFQQPGSGPLRADYLVGEDVVSGGGIRSLANPLAYGDPDHYSRRRIGLEDDGFVHINSGIPNHAFYLAIEGGTNRTSGRAVQGVGAANREQIENIFYRAFTLMLPASANFFLARLATIQAARDLYGTDSAAERAVTQAWDAVGVHQQAATLTFIFDPNPVPPAPLGRCTLARPNFVFTVGVAEVSGVTFNVRSSEVRFYNGAGVLSSTQPFNFAQLFAACGPGSSRIPANGVPCAFVCVTFGGAPGGFVDFNVSGVDDVGIAATFTSPRLRLGTTTAIADDTSYQGLCVPIDR